jgi:tRNA U34 5-carboxymethylaminomethyl modifying enzyme MnmG/GidA
MMEISIPSGAIKSTSVPALSTTITEFQFLLVRLRAGVADSEDTASIEFQFLLVRLRDFLMVKEQDFQPYFNSFWCD